jgi:hypothetical protein
MKYLCLVYLDQEHWSACPDHVCASYAQKLSDSRRLIAGEPLHPVDTATTVRVRNGQVQLYDGPFAETKELVAGFYLVDTLTRPFKSQAAFRRQSTAASRCGRCASWMSVNGE